MDLLHLLTSRAGILVGVRGFDEARGSDGTILEARGTKSQARNHVPDEREEASNANRYVKMSLAMQRMPLSSPNPHRECKQSQPESTCAATLAGTQATAPES